jgi:hypothetical protein
VALRGVGIGILLGLLAGPAIAACSDDGADPPTPQEAAARVVNDWGAAVDEGDGETACALMSEGGRAALMNPYEPLAPNRPPLADTCELAVPKLLDSSEEDEDEGGIVLVEPVAPEDVDIQGRTAVADSGGWCISMALEVVGWRVAGLPLPGDDDSLTAAGDASPCFEG